MSAKVIKSSTNLSAREILKTTSRVDATPLKEVDTGFKFPYYGFVEQEIVNDNTGEIFNSIIVISEPDETGERKLYASRSESFMKALYEILDVLEEMGDEDPFELRISKMKSKAGREFVTCSLA